MNDPHENMTGFERFACWMAHQHVFPALSASVGFCFFIEMIETPSPGRMLSILFCCVGAYSLWESDKKIIRAHEELLRELERRQRRRRGLR